jgi:hypothetical protein
MQTKKSEPTKTITSVLMAGLIVMSTIAVTASIIIMTSSIQSASALNTEGKDTRCLPRSEFNGRENAGNEHDAENPRNPHDTQLGFDRGNPHDRCVGS